MKKDNKGSTLITVIVAIAFVTILTSIILGTTVVNMSMKGIDRRVKDDFYYAERGLNDVFTGVGQVTADIAGDEYEGAFKQIGKTFATADDAYKEFKRQFLVKCFDKYKGADANDRKTKLDKYVVKTYLSSRIQSVGVVSVGIVEYKKKNALYTTATPDITAADFDDYEAVVIHDVKVSAIDKNDYQSVISSDIVIECPTVDFLGTNAEVTDYAIIGCQGVYFTGAGDTKVSGNLYGGVHATANANDAYIYPTPSASNPPLYGGINIYGSNVELTSNYVVSKGDINVFGNGSKFEIKSSNTSTGIPSVWFDTLRTIKPSTGSSSAEVTINNSNIFALNDMELNADKSTVTLENGDYYGYNDKTIPNEDKINSLDYTGGREDNDSSAIIINGNECKLDMSRLHSLVLMGKAFVDFSSKGTVPTGYDSIAASAESLALQPNQQLYVVPTDFMITPNPAIEDNLATDPDNPYGPKIFKLNKTKSELEKWFGYRYVETDKIWGDDEIVDDIYKKYAVTLTEGGVTETVYYAFLKFNDKLWIDPNPDDNIAEYEPAMYTNPETGALEPIPIEKLGMLGSVSSKTAFFDEIMSATGDTDTELQPSAYRLREKMKQSITNGDHFNLQDAVINMSDSSAVIYGRNAIVNYDIRNGKYKLKGNTDGLERFAGYPENLFNRYQIMCVFLDGKEDKGLRESVSCNVNQDPNKIISDWKPDPVTSPMDHFVLVGDMAGVDTTAVTNGTYINNDSANQAFGSCVIKTTGATPYHISGTFKGAAFVIGDVVVDSGAKIDGIIMATGTITIQGGGTVINSNKGLIQSRVDKELSLVEKGEAGYENNFLITYLTNNGTSKMYSATPGSRRDEDRIKPDYNAFMHYENWQKGNE